MAVFVFVSLCLCLFVRWLCVCVVIVWACRQAGVPPMIHLISAPFSLQTVTIHSFPNTLHLLILSYSAPCQFSLVWPFLQSVKMCLEMVSGVQGWWTLAKVLSWGFVECPPTKSSTNLLFKWKLKYWGAKIEFEILCRKKWHFWEIFAQFALHLAGTETSWERMLSYVSQNIINAHWRIIDQKCHKICNITTKIKFLCAFSESESDIFLVLLNCTSESFFLRQNCVGWRYWNINCEIWTFPQNARTVKKQLDWNWGGGGSAAVWGKIL